MLFEVTDDGPGIPEGEEEKIFQAFYRVGGKRDGLGLGLSLVKRIAEAHGGAVSAKNGADGGACIGFELPL